MPDEVCTRLEQIAQREMFSWRTVRSARDKYLKGITAPHPPPAHRKSGLSVGAHEISDLAGQPLALAQFAFPNHQRTPSKTAQSAANLLIPHGVALKLRL